MDSENVKAIELNGIVHNATKIGVRDGDCEDLVNLRFKDGSWRASGDGKHVFSMQYQSDVANTSGLSYTQLYIHTNVYRHILGVRESRLYWFGNIDTDGVFEALDTPAELTSVSGDLYICQTGHLLTIIDDAGGFEYLLFKPADTLYKKLYVDENGSQTDRGVYPFGQIHFNWADAGAAATGRGSTTASRPSGTAVRQTNRTGATGIIASQPDTMPTAYTIDELHALWDKANESDRSKPRKHSVQSEHRLQVACLKWLHLQYPNVLCYAIPNGGQRNKVVAGRLKDEGVTAGIPDLHIPIPNGKFASLYIEMKNGKAGVVSDKQKEMMERLKQYGNKVVVCRNIDDFRNEIDDYLKS